jgi:hypothetical protein
MQWASAFLTDHALEKHLLCYKIPSRTNALFEFNYWTYSQEYSSARYLTILYQLQVTRVAQSL